MSITFLSVPAGTKVPGVYTEVDTSKAQQGAAIQVRRVLLIGQRLSTGTKPAGQIDLISSDSQAREFYGKGSMLYHMVRAFLAQNKVNELNCIALDDDGGAVKAAGSIELTAPATGAGTLHAMIGGRQYNLAVAASDTEAAMISALVALITADEDRHVDVAVNGGNTDLMDITARHGGEVGNDIDIRLNYFSGQELPAGVAATITAMSGGTTNPSIASVITAMGEVQYHDIAGAYSDAANLLLMQTELKDRWGAIRANDGQYYFSRKESFANHISFLGGRNNEQESVMNVAGPTPTFEWAAEIAAIVSKEAQADPALPFQTTDFVNALAPLQSELLNYSERNQILQAGGSTFNVDPSGVPQMERMRTTRVENDFAAPDESLADLNPKLTLGYLRFDFRVNHLTKFSKHKLVNDGTRVGPGQRVISPSIGKAEAVARFELWEELGLVEGFEQFKRDLVVQRNSQDATRLDYLLSPDLANQLRVAGVQFGFLL